MIQVASLKKTSKKTSASRKERHNRPAPLLPTFDQINGNTTSSPAYQQPIAASPLDAICSLFASVIDQAGSEAVREWMTSAYTAMCNAICDNDAIATSLSSSHAVNEQLHGYVNEEYATAVRHKRQLESVNACLVAENNDLKRQIASLQTSLAAAATITLKPANTPNTCSSSNGSSNKTAAANNGIVVSVSSMTLPNNTRPTLSITIPTHNTQSVIEPQSTPASAPSRINSSSASQKVNQQKSPVLEALPLRRSHSASTTPITSSSKATSPSSPSLSPAQADCMLRELEAKVALAIGSPLTTTTPSSLSLSTTVVDHNNSSNTTNSNEIVVSVTKLTRRNSALRRSRSLGDEPAQSNVLASSLLYDNGSKHGGEGNNMVVTNIIRRSHRRNSRSRSPTDPNQTPNGWSSSSTTTTKQHRRSVSSSHCHQQATQLTPSTSPLELDLLRAAADQWVY